MYYIRVVCVMLVWVGDSNDNMLKRLGMDVIAGGADCGVVEWVKHYVLKWFGHVMRINEDDIM